MPVFAFEIEMRCRRMAANGGERSGREGDFDTLIGGWMIDTFLSADCLDIIGWLLLSVVAVVIACTRMSKLLISYKLAFSRYLSLSRVGCLWLWCVASLWCIQYYYKSVAIGAAHCSHPCVCVLFSQIHPFRDAIIEPHMSAPTQWRMTQTADKIVFYYFPFQLLVRLRLQLSTSFFTIFFSFAAHNDIQLNIYLFFFVDIVVGIVKSCRIIINTHKSKDTHCNEPTAHWKSNSWKASLLARECAGATLVASRMHSSW